MSADERALATRIRVELEEIAATVERARRQMEKARRWEDDDYRDAVALNLHGFYSGIERVFEAIARDLDGSVPSGPEWHRDLLYQMAGPVDHVRPAVIAGDARRCLEEYRAFRHVVRNLYAFNLRSTRIEELVAALSACYDRVQEDFLRFCSFLEEISS